MQNKEGLCLEYPPRMHAPQNFKSDNIIATTEVQEIAIKQAVNPIGCACIGNQIESLKHDLVNLRQGAADILACFAEIRLRTEARP